MLTVRPENDIQLVAAAVGEIVSVSVEAQLESATMAGIVHEYADVSIV